MTPSIQILDASEKLVEVAANNNAASVPSGSGTNTQRGTFIDGMMGPLSSERVLDNKTTSVASSSGYGDTNSRADSKKSAKEQAGREKGAFAYGAEEHLTLLSFITMTPNAFNASETSLEWRLVHSKMVEVYQGMGVSAGQSTMLHSHFMELYSALKPGIRAHSLREGSPKCPTVITDGAEESESYITALFEVLISGSRKFQPKKWWSLHMMKALLICHLQNMKKFGSGAQNQSWLEAQKAVKKNKFDLVTCLEKLAGTSNSNVDEKMQKMQDQIDNRFATLDNKLI
jgi:hypothetical protein